MSKAIVTEACTLAFRGADTNPSVKGTITPIFTSCEYVVSGDKVVYQIQVAISSYTNGTLTNGAGTGVITGTAQYIKVDTQVPLLEGDESASITITGTVGSSTKTTSDTVYVKSAGQNVLKAT